MEGIAMLTGGVRPCSIVARARDLAAAHGPRFEPTAVVAPVETGARVEE
jgi:hypothetical protein